MQITCNTLHVFHVQHAACHVVRRDSSAIKFDRAVIAFLLVLLHWLKPLTDGAGEGTGVPGEKPRRPAPEMSLLLLLLSSSTKSSSSSSSSSSSYYHYYHHHYNNNYHYCCYYSFYIDAVVLIITIVIFTTTTTTTTTVVSVLLI